MPSTKLRKCLLMALVVVWLPLLFTSCTKTKSRAKPCVYPSQVKGFNYSPFGFPLDFSKIGPFLAEVVNLKDSGVIWSGPWRDDFLLGSDAGQIPEAAGLIATGAQNICYMPMAVFQWRAAGVVYLQIPDNVTNDWTNTDAITLFQTMLVDFATEYEPPYMFLGSDNDFYYETNAADYANWLSAYNDFYDAIKAASPSTQVGPVFSNEHISGQGTHMGFNMTYWDAIDDHDFDKVDVVGVTLYPFYHYDEAADVPADHLDLLESHVQNKPMAIIETGWPAQNLDGLNPAWATTNQQQVDYVTSLFAMISGKTVPMVNWLFLNYMVDEGSASVYWKTFGSVSVRDSTGEKRPVYDIWAAK